MFLLTFSLVNLSLIALRRPFPEVKQRFCVPLYPVTPVVAIVVNLLLDPYPFECDHRSWYIAQVWIVLGLFVYYIHFQKAAMAQMPEVREVPRMTPPDSCPCRILIPLHNPDYVLPLMQLAAPLASAHGGESVVLGVIDLSQNLPVHEGMPLIQHKGPILTRALEFGSQLNVPLRRVLQIAHRVYDGILHAADDEKASLILMGWKGYTSAANRIFGKVTDKVVHHAPCDLITVNLVGDLSVQRILMPTAGGPHAALAAEYVALYAEGCKAAVTCSYFVPEDAAEDQNTTTYDRIEQTIEGTGLEMTVKRILIAGQWLATRRIKADFGYDLLVIGASKEGFSPTSCLAKSRSGSRDTPIRRS